MYNLIKTQGKYKTNQNFNFKYLKYNICYNKKN